MNDILAFNKSVMDSYWENSAYQWLFYVGLCVIFFKEKDYKKRNLMFWLPLLLYVFLASPLFAWLGGMVWGTESTAYLCRQFSLVPIFFVIAYAGTLLLSEFTGIKKLLLICAACFSVVAFGSKLIYVHDFYGFEKSENVYKIPDDVIMVCDYLSSVEEDPVIAIDTDLSFMVRQYNPSVHLLIGPRGYGNPFSDAISSENPDVDYIMMTACERGGDFVVVKNMDSVRLAFEEKEFCPCYETTGLLVYKCGGYPGVCLTYNGLKQVIRMDYYDENGNPRLNENGIAAVEYKYDDDGYVVEEKYFDADGKGINN